MSLWKILYWLIGTVGVAGTIALFAIYPAIMGSIWRGIIKLFALILSYRLGCAIVAAIAVGFAVDYWRHSRDDAAYAEQTAAFEQAQRDRDKKIAKETREAVWVEIANATAESAVTDKEVKEFTDVLPPVPETGNPFRVGADAGRLCKIAGQARCGPPSPQGVPKAKGAGVSSGNRGKLRLPHLVSRGAGSAQKGQ
jgi:hypothetical protein